MSMKMLTILAATCVVSAVAQLGHYGHGYVQQHHGYAQQHHGHDEHHYEHAPAKYHFEYSVHDGHTGDVKEQAEQRDGDHVQGHYSLAQPDGRQRIVHYTADKHTGFQAHVEYKGKAVHQPQQHHHVAPVHHVAVPVVQHHAIPVATVHHVAPIVHHHQPIHSAHHGATSHISNSGPIHDVKHHY